MKKFERDLSQALQEFGWRIAAIESLEGSHWGVKVWHIEKETGSRPPETCILTFLAHPGEETPDSQSRIGKILAGPKPIYSALDESGAKVLEVDFRDYPERAIEFARSL